MTESPIYIDRLTCGTLDTAAPRTVPRAAGPRRLGPGGRAPSAGLSGGPLATRAPPSAPAAPLAPVPAAATTPVAPPASVAPLAPVAPPAPAVATAPSPVAPLESIGAVPTAAGAPRDAADEDPACAGGREHASGGERGLGSALGAALGLTGFAATRTFRGRAARGSFALEPFAACGAWTLCVAGGAGAAVFALARASAEKQGSVARVTGAPGAAGETWEVVWPAGGAPALVVRGGSADGAPFVAVATGCGPAHEPSCS